jgi:hypothetical protein
MICGEPIYVPEINDINYTRRLQAYEKEVNKPFTTNSNIEVDCRYISDYVKDEKKETPLPEPPEPTMLWETFSSVKEISLSKDSKNIVK